VPPGPIVDNKLLTQFLGQLGGQNAGNGICRASRRLRNDEPDWVIGILGSARAGQRDGERQCNQTKLTHHKTPELSEA